MLFYVIDASVVVKWFCEEPGRGKALEIDRRAKLGEVTLCAPELLIYEVGNVLWKGKKFDAQHIQRALFALWRADVEFVPLEQNIIESAVLLTTKYGITFYDASYAAIAYRRSCPLITANPKDHRKIKEIEVKELSQMR